MTALCGALRKSSRAFVNPQGRLRAPWLLLLGYALYALWTHAAAQGLSRAFSGLFAAWGLTSANLHLAPAWARMIARSYGGVISIVSSVGVVGLSLALMRVFLRERPNFRFEPAAFAAGSALGAGAALASAGLFLALDSMRLDASAGSAGLNGEMLLLLLVYLAAAGAEEVFSRALVLRAVLRSAGERRWARMAACGVSGAMLVLITGSARLGVIGALNVFLMGVLCAGLHLKGRAFASLGLRFAWSYASVALVSFPGGNAAGAPLFALYHVSDGWLTGGGGGLICGAWMTALLAIALAALYRPWRAWRRKG